MDLNTVHTLSLIVLFLCTLKCAFSEATVAHFALLVPGAINTVYHVGLWMCPEMLTGFLTDEVQHTCTD